MAEEVDNKDNLRSKRKRPWWKRGLRILGRITFTLLVLFLSLILFVRSRWGQDMIVGKVTNYISGKTHTKVSIKNLFITFSGNIDLQGLYLEDMTGDTLIYSEKLQVDIPLWPIIKGNPISIDGLEWTGLVTNIVRKDSTDGFNYQFLIDAFASDSNLETTDKTSSEPPEINIGSIYLSDVRVNFKDNVSGTNANLILGNFRFEGKKFDLKKMNFQVEELFLENTKVEYVQTKPSPPSESSESVLPYLSLDNLKFKNVTVHYSSLPDGLVADLNLADFQLQVPTADLVSKDIKVNLFILNNSNILVKLNAQKEPLTKQEINTTSQENKEPFNWPNWSVLVESIALQNNQMNYQIGEKSKEIKNFNPDYIVLNEFNFKAKDISLSKNKSAKLQLEDFSFREGSGLILNQLVFSAALDSTEFSIEDLVFTAGNSSMKANLKTQFTSFQQFINKPEYAVLTLDLKQFVVDLNDAFKVQPALRKNENLKKLAENKITGQIKAKGTLSAINLSKFVMNWGQNTAISTNGDLKNLTDFNKFIAEIDNFTFNSTRSDLTNFVSEKDLGISIPEKVFLQTQFNGKVDNFNAKIQLLIPEGEIKIDGQFRQQNEIVFAAKVNVIELNLGKILKNPTIGTVGFEMIATGKGKTINDLDATLASNFSKMELRGYDFSALQLDGKLNNGKGNVTVKYKDQNLDLLVDSKIQLDSISPKVAVNFNMEGADLFALGLTEEQIKAKLKMNANFEGNANQFEFDSHLFDGIAVQGENTYSLGIVDISASVSKDSTAMDISSNFLNGKLRANADLDRIGLAIQQHLKSYFSDSITRFDSPSNPIKLQMNMKLSDSKMLTEFLLPNIKRMDTLDMDMDFNQLENKLAVNFNLPYLDYADKTIDSLQLKFNSTEKDAKFKFGFATLNAQPFVLKRTFFDGDLKNGLLKLNFNAFDGEKEMYVVRTEITGKSSNLKIHLNPENLILQGETWLVPDKNQISILNKNITAQNFVLSRNNQSLTIANDLMKTSENNIGIGFKNFKLDNLLALFNKDDLLASGDLQGNIVAINLLDNFGLNADFSIDNLTALKAPLGKLNLKANSKSGDNYNLNLGIKGDDVDFEIKGDYSAIDSSSGLDFNLNLNKLGMKTIAIISGESLKDASGDISGEIAFQGKVSSPEYKGYLQFNDAVFNVSQLNSTFRLANDRIEIDNSNITLNQFSVEDEQKNTFTLNGSISTEILTDPAFDLSVYGKNFQILNSSKEDNDLYYGIVNFDMEGIIKGKMSFPVVDLNIGINENTNFTYVIPESVAQLEKRDGIVEFVNIENPDNILTRTNNSNDKELFGGIELHANLTIDNGSNFNVIIDPRNGDNLKVTGVGALDFNIANNGLMTLSGRYDIDDGHYSLSLYNLVKRRFELEKGSSIVWSGDPMNADLNVTAKYEIETSASALMASQTSGASEAIQNKYRQKLPFFVFLNVNGELDEPKLNFRLDMPEESRGAIDGTVYSQIKQLNNEEDALNKQVFSLLVLKKFYPNSGSDGSSGGAEPIIRKNINDALSEQLNVFSDKLTGNTGIELDFGLNSYTDFQQESAEQRTDLNVSAQKKLLDDRLIVQVGSVVNVEGGANAREENPVVGNSSIQYLLTKDGQWRLKGFRNSEYENIIDGQVFINGISLIFQRQFNSWNELFVAPAKEEDTTDKTKTDEPKNKGKKPKTDK